MKSELILNFLKNREILKKKLEEIKSSPKINLKNNWNSYLPFSKECECAAIDGSYNYLKFRSVVLYAINVSLITYKNKKVNTEFFSEFDVIEDFMFLEDFLRSEMINKELEVASKICKNFNIMLDGSLNSFFNLVTKEKRKEYLKIFEESDKLIFSISKTPIKSFEENIEVGFSNIIEKYENNKLISFYFKLRKNSLVFKVETIEKNKDKIEEIVSIIRFFDINGYPYILIKAHREAKISNKDLELLAKLLGIKEKTGREIL